MEIYGLEISKTSELAPTKSFDIIFWFQGFPSILEMSSKLSSFGSKSAHVQFMYIQVQNSNFGLILFFFVDYWQVLKKFFIIGRRKALLKRNHLGVGCFGFRTPTRQSLGRQDLFIFLALITILTWQFSMQKIANSSWVQIIWVGVSIAQQIVQKTESCHLNIKYAGFIYIYCNSNQLQS